MPVMDRLDVIIGLLVGAGLGGAVVWVIMIARRRQGDMALVNVRARAELRHEQAPNAHLGYEDL